MNKFQLTKHFNLREFQCRHCGQVKVDSRLVNKLQMFRYIVGQPITITSGYRCPTHNKAVGGAPKSKHMEGIAADIRVEGMTPKQVAELADKAGFTGIGIYKNFVHLDIRPNKARWIG